MSTTQTDNRAHARKGKSSLTSYPLRCPNVVTFSFYLQDMLLSILANCKRGQSGGGGGGGGVAATLLSLRHSKNFENKKFPFASKLLKLTGGQFWVEKNESGHKNVFFKVNFIK